MVLEVAWRGTWAEWESVQTGWGRMGDSVCLLRCLPKSCPAIVPWKISI